MNHMAQPNILTSLGESGKRFWIEQKRYFYKDSIFQVFENQKYERQVGKYKNEPMINKITYALNSHLIVQSKALVVGSILPYVVSKLVNEKPATVKFTDCSFLTMVISGPLLEELIFRGILQNSIRKVQQYVPKPLAIASIRIAVTSALFAGMHLLNSGDYLSKSDAITQCAMILLYPSYSTLYEKTGSLIPGIVAHMANNFVVYSICKLIGV